MKGSIGARRRLRRSCPVGAFAALALLSPLSPSAMAADDCPNAAVRAQQRATSLPDCRAYEIVNPASDDVGEVNRMPGMSDDGNTLAYLSVIAGDQALGNGVVSTSVARRGPGGWTSTTADFVSRAAVYQVSGEVIPKVFTPDFSRLIVDTTFPGVAGDLNGSADLYRVEAGSGKVTLMSSGFPLSPAQRLLATTPSLDRLIFLQPSGIYESDGTSLQLVAGGTAQAAAPPYQRGLGVADDRGLSPAVERGGAHGASDDMRRFYYYDSFASGAGPLQLRDATTDPAQTIPVSISSRTGDVGTMYYANFISASHRGSVAYFSSEAQLTDAATPGGGIYRFDLATRAVAQITPDAGDPTGLHLAGAMASDDQSHLYFTSTSALAGGAQAGDSNVYVWTSDGGVRFIAKVASGEKVLRVTPDGRYALLLSTASIAGAPNNGQQAVYRYDDVTREIDCVSCRPDGSPSEGTAAIDTQSYGMPAAQIAHGRALTRDGRVVFTSTDRLVRDDQTTAQDVYLYAGGKVSLLTRGTGDTDSYIGDISDDGKNILLVTRADLVGADRDPGEYDLYNVRADGGFLEPPPGPEPCRGDDCQGPAKPRPERPRPSSPRVTSPGNPPPAKVIKRLSVSRLTASQRSVLARTGKVSMTIKVTGGGTVVVRGRGKVAGKTQTVGRVSGTVLKRSAASLKLTFRLSVAARRQLARRHRLSITVETRLSGLSKPATSTVSLSRGR